MDIISYILSRKYTDNAIVGLGAIRGANCTVKDIVHQDGINTVTFEWTGTDGTTKTRDMVVYDGTPIYVWESGNAYHYGDLAIYESQFYRCIVENNDAVFDDTKWNEIGSPDGNYDVVQSKALLPARFTAADRKLYFVIDECIFYLWDGYQWVALNHAVQVDSFPTASAKYLNKIYQYIGNTDANYTHGYFYQCVSNGETPAVYSWEYVQTSDIQIATTQQVGIVKPDGETIDVDSNGTISIINRLFVGTEAAWDALTPTEQARYKTLHITDDGQTIDLGIYLRKVTTMPLAEDCPSETVMYIGATTADYTRGYIYRSTPIVEDDVIIYNWVRQNTQPNIQSDWEQTNSSACDYIKNKPILGTASGKNYTSNVRPNNTDLVESHAVYSAINSALSSIYVPRGELSCAELTADLLIPANVGNVYTMSDSGTTSALFINGAGHPIAVNDNVGIIRAGADSIMFNLMGNAFDLHDYQTKELETPITIDGTEVTEVESALGGLNEGLDKRVTYKYNGIMGAKNLLPYPYGPASAPREVTFTDNNGIITCNGVDVNYTSYYNLYKNICFLPKGKYIISVDTILPSGVYIQVVYYDGTTENLITDIRGGNNSSLFEITDDIINGEWLLIRVAVLHGTQLDNLVLYPMLRYADDTDNTYQPYAKTNYQLTQDVMNLNNIPEATSTGNNSIIENDLTNNVSSGEYSHAEGNNTKANGRGAHSEGVGSSANGYGAHAEGQNTSAWATSAHSEGVSTSANGQASHAEGNMTTAQGSYSHAEGSECRATGNFAHAQNHFTNANGMSQTVIGEYNITQGTTSSKQDTDYALIIGNGTADDARSNALAVQWDGNVVFQDGSKQKSSPYAIMGELGAKNLIHYPYSDGNQKVVRELSFTVNKDTSITVNGTATVWSGFYFKHSDIGGYSLKKGKYILSYSASSDTNASIQFVVVNSSGEITFVQGVYGHSGSVEFEITDEVFQSFKNSIVQILIYFDNGAVVNNVTIYPMFRYADDQDSTWQPYAMTNKELTNKVNEIESKVRDINTTLDDKLDKISSLPTPSATYLDKVYLLTSTQTGYQKGGIYQCVSDGQPTPTYSWQLISSADMVEFTAQELQAMW